jgi:hypothetical protein
MRKVLLRVISDLLVLPAALSIQRFARENLLPLPAYVPGKSSPAEVRGGYNQSSDPAPLLYTLRMKGRFLPFAGALAKPLRVSRVPSPAKTIPRPLRRGVCPFVTFRTPSPTCLRASGRPCHRATRPHRAPQTRAAAAFRRPGAATAAVGPVAHRNCSHDGQAPVGRHWWRGGSVEQRFLHERRAKRAKA